MIKYILLIIISSIYSCSNSSKQETSKKSSAEDIKSSIEFSKKIIDFGTLSNDTIVQALFYIKNIGIANLIIEDVSPECSCTGYKLDNNTILPGNSTKLLVNFSTKGKAEGLQRKAIIIRSNTEKEYNTLFIKCNIIQK
ncbi:MAG: DUF1573 domain-containing protein [Bacteroidota bacterium]|nr:hypothetical protein [Odoribacter sp.]MDP3642548.1 DUF1573 domain-containing protein [Bacteroidota bacterium]